MPWCMMESNVTKSKKSLKCENGIKLLSPLELNTLSSTATSGHQHQDKWQANPPWGLKTVCEAAFWITFLLKSSAASCNGNQRWCGMTNTKNTKLTPQSNSHDKKNLFFIVLFPQARFLFGEGHVLQVQKHTIFHGFLKNSWWETDVGVSAENQWLASRWHGFNMWQLIRCEV